MARIRFIRRAQELGFSLDEIADLLALRVEDPAACGAVESATRAKLEDVESRILELELLRGILNDLIGSCRAREATSECPVLENTQENRRFTHLILPVGDSADPGMVLGDVGGPIGQKRPRRPPVSLVVPNKWGSVPL